MKFKYMAALSLTITMAQPAISDDFDDFVSSAVTEFDNYISKADKEFVDFLRAPWVYFEAEKPIEKRIVPEPITPVTVDSSIIIKNNAPVRLSVKEIIDKSNKETRAITAVKSSTLQPIAVSRPVKQTPASVTTKPAHEPACRTNPTHTPEVQPTINQESTHHNLSAAAEGNAPKIDTKNNIPAPASENVSYNTDSQADSNPLYVGGPGREKIEYGGKTYYVDNSLKNSIRLKGVAENQVADAYEKLLKTDYKRLIADLKTLRQNNLGNDWALFKYIQKVSETFVGKNESVVMRQFLLNKLGYMARMGRMANGKDLTLLYVPDCQLYACVYVDINGNRYFDVDNKTGKGFYICKNNAPGVSDALAMDIKVLPDMNADRITSTRSDNVTSAVTVDVPKALIDFYSTLPQCDYSVYANATVDKTLETQLLSQLRQSIDGKSETEAADILLSFVQSGFKYQTDPQQFGYEKPFFVEELFYYPACDCEDRSVLYRYLVKKLLGLDVVLLEYPNHVATAVRFSTDVEGDNILIGKNKYIVCDPTYIGASIGMAMPSFKSVAAKIIKI